MHVHFPDNRSHDDCWDDRDDDALNQVSLKTQKTNSDRESYHAENDRNKFSY